MLVDAPRSDLDKDESFHAQETHFHHRLRLAACPLRGNVSPPLGLGQRISAAFSWVQGMWVVGRDFTRECSRTEMSHVCTLQGVLASLKVSLGTSDTKFSAALGTDKRISVAGTVKGSQSYLTRVGTFDVDLSLQGIILLVSGHHSTLHTEYVLKTL